MKAGNEKKSSKNHSNKFESIPQHPSSEINLSGSQKKIKEVKTSKNTAWILGKFYNLDSEKEEFRNHAESFFRFTYRRDFPALEPYPITSDSGWGCMLRAAQMLMGYMLRRHYLGTDWRVPKLKEELLRKNEDYCEIIRWFLDFPGFPHIYSIHHLTQSGMKYDKLPGEWYGPSTASYVLRDLSKIHRLRYQGEVAIMVTQGDTIYISEVEKLCSNISLNENFFGLQDSNYLLNNTTFTERFQRLSLNMMNNRKASPSSRNSITAPNPTLSKSLESIPENKRKDPLTSAPDEDKEEFFDPLFRPPPSQINPWVYSLVLLLPLRLGIHSVNEEYITELKDVLQNPACIGILGGRPNHAIYFVGYHTKDNCLYGLDPHTVYPNPPGDSLYDNTVFPSEDYVHQVHVRDFVTLDFKQLDPSLAIGFYFQNRQEFNEFCLRSRARNDRLREQKLTPLFQVEHLAPSYMFDDTFESFSPGGTNKNEKVSSLKEVEKAFQQMGIHDDDFDEQKNSEDLDDEYVFL